MRVYETKDKRTWAGIEDHPQSDHKVLVVLALKPNMKTGAWTPTHLAVLSRKDLKPTNFTYG